MDTCVLCKMWLVTTIPGKVVGIGWDPYCKAHTECLAHSGSEGHIKLFLKANHHSKLVLALKIASAWSALSSAGRPKGSCILPGCSVHLSYWVWMNAQRLRVTLDFTYCLKKIFKNSFWSTQLLSSVLVIRPLSSAGTEVPDHRGVLNWQRMGCSSWSRAKTELKDPWPGHL